MDKIEEIKELKVLFDEGAITEEEFQMLKKEIVSKAKTSSTNQEKIEENVKIGKKKKFDGMNNKLSSLYELVKRPEIATKFIVTISILIIFVTGLYSGKIGNSYVVALISVVVLIIVYVILFKLLLLKFKKLTSSLILISVPFLVIALFNSPINVFSKYTYNKNIEKVVTYQYGEYNKQIPYEIYHVRKDTFIIYNRDTTYIKTGMFKRFDEEGNIMLKGVIEDGLLRGDWTISGYDDVDMKVHFDMEAS